MSDVSLSEAAQFHAAPRHYLDSTYALHASDADDDVDLDDLDDVQHGFRAQRSGGALKTTNTNANFFESSILTSAWLKKFIHNHNCTGLRRRRALPDAIVLFASMLSDHADVVVWLNTHHYIERWRCAHTPTPLDERQRGALLLLARAHNDSNDDVERSVLEC